MEEDKTTIVIPIRSCYLGINTNTTVKFLYPVQYFKGILNDCGYRSSRPMYMWSSQILSWDIAKPSLFSIIDNSRCFFMIIDTSSGAISSC